ncbi:MBL fold metallo-hydrolase [Azospirillum thermophilum]|uniref:MBL fold metallo-hydrolase n=1 Tax=Azospirillum thermophilum TaxID=2202148 RepID=A0A2S2CV64_9PROT|nr:MBL fold metallo-hydrolase [Azospirillum thermophilum]AWK88414.1 MBL fold metallo-hydrolase [Azospirillum thermophilum]
MSRLLPVSLARTAFALAFAGLAATVLPSGPAAAEPPQQQRTQVPGYYRMALGEFEVTALYDGYIDLDPGILTRASAEDIQGLLARMFVESTPGMQTAVNAFLVHTGRNLVLVDTGAAGRFGPTLGAIPANIRAAGYDPAAVDTVLLTHLHPDHAAGLMTAGGAVAFPNATVWTAQEEAGFWLDEQAAAQAPKEVQPFFAMAREVVAAYDRAGRFKTFVPGGELLPGIASVAAAGHTPGHSGFLFASQGRSLLVWGDVVHNHAVQFPRPEVAIEFDSDQSRAVATRQRLFAEAAAQKLWVAGAHLPFPGLGHVRAEQQGYAWVPVEFGPLR